MTTPTTTTPTATTRTTRRRFPVHGRRPVRRVAGLPPVHAPRVHGHEPDAEPVPAPRIHPRRPQVWPLVQLALVTGALMAALVVVLVMTGG